jgi:hypothetical protein
MNLPRVSLVYTYVREAGAGELEQVPALAEAAEVIMTALLANFRSEQTGQAGHPASTCGVYPLRL